LPHELHSPLLPSESAFGTVDIYIVKMTIRIVNSSVDNMQAEIDELINEVRLLFNTLVQTVEHIHAGVGVTMAQRAVLEFLLKSGPATVPEIARRRRVSRQHIQMLVNPLLDSGAVEKIDNPAHRRSVLIRLTGDGERTIREMQDKETRFLESSGLTVSDKKLQQSSKVLRSVRQSIESAN